MKRWIASLLTVFLLLGCLSACTRYPQAQESVPPAEETAPAVAAEPAPTVEPAPTEEPAETEVPAETEAPSETEAPAETAAVSPLLWKVTDEEGHILYLFGTIHVGDTRNDEVLLRVSRVLDDCDALAVEFDSLAYAEDTQRAMKDMMQYVLNDGSSITDYMPEELYQRSYELLEEVGLFPSLFSRYNLAMWSQLIESAMLMKYTALDTEKGMDGLLIQHCYDRALPVLDIESASFQMDLLNSFDNELYLLLIEETLDSADTYEADLSEMYELWLSGDREAFWALLEGEESEEEDAGDYTEEQIAMIEDYNRKLLDERNLGMRDKALEYLSSGQTVFFAVGAAHMANEAGLVQLLSDAGCSVEEIDY
ncbi:MAG: TraB/GumN family protein [Clostridia bacterium]